mmetsp:Transcript_74516/g.207018  ORF Transcript_74516/g.207018 Transcript_74516/m.207018 type:complete len:206 (+) Transcript_74516:657-1274(+)
MRWHLLACSALWQSQRRGEVHRVVAVQRDQHVKPLLDGVAEHHDVVVRRIWCPARQFHLDVADRTQPHVLLCRAPGAKEVAVYHEDGAILASDVDDPCILGEIFSDIDPTALVVLVHGQLRGAPSVSMQLTVHHGGRHVSPTIQKVASHNPRPGVAGADDRVHFYLESREKRPSERPHCNGDVVNPLIPLLRSLGAEAIPNSVQD